MFQKLYFSARDILGILFSKNANFYTRWQVLWGVIQLKIIHQKSTRGAVQTFRFFGHQMQIFHPGDVQFMVKEIWLECPYKTKNTAPIRKIVDLGANQGFTFLYFKQQHPQASIVAVEADKQNFEVLLQNTQELQSPEDVLLMKAAWNKDGVLYAASEAHTQSTNRFFTDEIDGKAEVIEAFDFAQWLLQNPADLVKVDIEGAEAEVMDGVILKGALTAASHWFIEFHTERFGNAVYERVSEAFLKAGFYHEQRGIVGYFYK